MHRMLKFAALGAVLGLTGLALAQPLPPNFFGPELWTDPAPAIYRIKAAGSDLCVNREPGSTSTELPHMVLRPCATPIAFQSIALTPVTWQGIPNEATGTAPSPFNQPSFVTWRMTTPFNGRCLTAARGVVFGPPAVDEVECGRNADGIPRGISDQMWYLVRSGPVHTFQIRDFLHARCWTAQGGQVRSGVSVVLERCNAATGGQNFVIADPHADLVEDYNRRDALEFGWLPIPGMGSSPPARFRSMPRLNLPSGDYTQGLATANDQGLACAQACADDASCKGFTWVDPRARGGQAMCYKKNSLNQPVADNFTNSGIVRPG